MVTGSATATRTGGSTAMKKLTRSLHSCCHTLSSTDVPRRTERWFR